LSITIATGATKFIGPFEINRFNDASGLVTVTLSATSLTGVTIAAISL
jgi:hypothetical protein